MTKNPHNDDTNALHSANAPSDSPEQVTDAQKHTAHTPVSETVQESHSDVSETSENSRTDSNVVEEELPSAQFTDVAALNKQLERYRAELLEIRLKLREREAELELSHKLGRESSTKFQEEHALRLRTAADLENYRKRAIREREETVKFGQERLLRELLPVIDNLERALDPKNSTDLSALREGVEMTYKLFEGTLARVGLKGFSAVGQQFDPCLHEAMQAVESDEPPGIVLSEMVRGYLLNDRLIRPAMVFVAKAKEAVQPSCSKESTSPSSGTPETLPTDEDNGASRGVE